MNENSGKFFLVFLNNERRFVILKDIYFKGKKVIMVLILGGFRYLFCVEEIGISDVESFGKEKMKGSGLLVIFMVKKKNFVFVVVIIGVKEDFEENVINICVKLIMFLNEWRKFIVEFVRFGESCLEVVRIIMDELVVE